jgi:hypothetical protein
LKLTWLRPPLNLTAIPALEEGLPPGIVSANAESPEPPPHDTIAETAVSPEAWRNCLRSIVGIMIPFAVYSL